jgi:hypothetical protein
MTRFSVRRLALAALGWALATSPAARAAFTTGDIFASYSETTGTNNVAHYNSAGTYLGSLPIPSSSIYWSTRGLVVGPDGLLYVVQDRFLDGFAVLTYNSEGVLQQTYTYNGPGNYLGGNISYGKIAFDAGGHFLVGAGGGLVEFTQGSPSSGTLFFPTKGNGVFDVTPLTNGDLLAVSAYDLYEVNPSGVAVRDLKWAQSGATFVSFGDLRGVVYDGSANVYVTMLGYTGYEFQIMKIDYGTDNLLASATFNYADDLFLRTDGNLIVGSRTQVPEIVDSNLNLVGSLSATAGPRMFVTQVAPATVPEPRSLALLGVALVAALLAGVCHSKWGLTAHRGRPQAAR